MPSEDFEPPALYLKQLTLWLHSNDYSEKTRNLYTLAVKRWLGFARPWEDGWQVRSINWRRSLTSHALKTQAVFVGAAKGFVDWLMDEDLLTGRNPLASAKFRGIKDEQTKKRALTDDEVLRLFATCDLSTLRGLRDHVMFRIMLHMALRVSAVGGIDLGDIEQQGKMYVLTYRGKGSEMKARRKVIPPIVMGPLDKYLKASKRKLSGTGPLFLKEDGAPITIHGMRKALERRMDAAGLEDSAVTIHSLRHTAATKAIESGVDLRAIQKLLDHESLATTDGYVHNRRQLKEGAELTISYGSESNDAE